MYCLDDGKIKCSNVMSDLDLKNTEAILYHVVISTIFASRPTLKSMRLVLIVKEPKPAQLSSL